MSAIIGERGYSNIAMAAVGSAFILAATAVIGSNFFSTHFSKAALYGCLGGIPAALIIAAISGSKATNIKKQTQTQRDEAIAQLKAQGLERLLQPPKGDSLLDDNVKTLCEALNNDQPIAYIKRDKVEKREFIKLTPAQVAYLNNLPKDFPINFSVETDPALVTNAMQLYCSGENIRRMDVEQARAIIDASKANEYFSKQGCSLERVSQNIIHGWDRQGSIPLNR